MLATKPGGRVGSCSAGDGGIHYESAVDDLTEEGHRSIGPANPCVLLSGIPTTSSYPVTGIESPPHCAG